MRRSLVGRCTLILASVAPGSLLAQGGPVAGGVVSRATGSPVASAQVAVAGTALRVLTTADGRFTLSDVPGTTAVLEVRMIGFRARTDTVKVGDTNVRIDRKSTRLNSSHGYISY